MRTIIYTSPTGEIGGGEKVLVELAKNAGTFGYKPVFALMRPGPLATEIADLGIECYSFREHRYRELHSVVKGGFWLRSLTTRYPDVLFHVNHTAHVYTWWAGEREIWHLHDTASGDWMEMLQKRLPSTYAIFTAPHVQEGYRELALREAVTIAPTCVPYESLKRIVPASQILDRVGLRSRPFCLTIARIQQHKGIHVLLDAVPAVVKAYPDFRFCIAGKAAGDEQLCYLRSLQRQVRELGIERNVVFTGFVTDEELVALLRATEFMVHPALSEGFGLVILQAMALGVPVIAADADGPRTILEDGVSGVLVKRGDSKELAGALLRVIGNREERDNLSSHGKCRAEAFSYQRFLEQTFAFYDRVYEHGRCCSR